MTPKSQLSDQYTDEQAEQRFMATVRSALKTPPKPLKTMTPKGVLAQSKKGQKKSSDDA